MGFLVSYLSSDITPRVPTADQNFQRFSTQLLSFTDRLNSSTRVGIPVFERTCQGAKPQCGAEKAYSTLQGNNITFLHMISFRKLTSTENFTQNKKPFQICAHLLLEKCRTWAEKIYKSQVFTMQRQPLLVDRGLVVSGNITAVQLYLMGNITQNLNILLLARDNENSHICKDIKVLLGLSAYLLLHTYLFLKILPLTYSRRRFSRFEQVSLLFFIVALFPEVRYTQAA